MFLTHGYTRDLPGYTQLFDYGDRTDGQPVYRGTARNDEADESTPKWIIIYVEYNESGDAIKTVGKIGAWDARETLFA